MPAAKFEWTSTPENVFVGGFRVWSIAKRAIIFQMISSRQPEMLNWVRTNALWKDRTGAARELFEVNISKSMLANYVQFAHGVFYGEYLETHNGGRFAIIAKAVDFWGPEIMRNVQEILLL